MYPTIGESITTLHKSGWLVAVLSVSVLQLMPDLFLFVVVICILRCIVASAATTNGERRLREIWIALCQPSHSEMDGKCAFPSVVTSRQRQSKGGSCASADSVQIVRDHRNWEVGISAVAMHLIRLLCTIQGTNMFVREICCHRITPFQIPDDFKSAPTTSVLLVVQHASWERRCCWKRQSLHFSFWVALIPWRSLYCIWTTTRKVLLGPDSWADFTTDSGLFNTPD